jgi:retron-type reverse transcriptase
LVPGQFGFRQGKSAENAASQLTNSVLKSVNQKMHVEGIFCDLAKAFDCINHKILLAQLSQHSRKRSSFRSYLTNRKQKNEIKSFEKFSSKWGTVKHGIPPGSILGPLIFIIYVNDLFPTINTLSEAILFADDTHTNF